MDNNAINNSIIKESLNTIIAYCRERENRQASCLGCPARKPYETKQPEVCKFHMIERPSDIV